MLKCSPAIDFITNHCVRFPVGGVSIVYNKDDELQPKIHQFCDEPIFCSDSVFVCNDINALPYYDYEKYNNCDLIEFEYNDECNKPVSTISKKYGDITLSNTRGQYSFYATGDFENCDGDLVYSEQATQILPGQPIRLQIGFKKQCCDDTAEYITLATGTITEFPEINNTNGANDTIRIHFEDNMNALLDQPIAVQPYSGPAGQVIQDILEANNISIYVPDLGTNTVTFTPEPDKTIADYLDLLVAFNGGRVYIDSNGQFRYDTAEYMANESPTPNFIVNTFDHVLNMGSLRRGTIYNRVKVQQFTNPGGVECILNDGDSQSKYGVKDYVYTNELISTPAQACEIATRILREYSLGDYERDVEVLGLPCIESGDIIQLVERVKKQACPDCGCQNLRQRVNYRVCRVNGRFGSNGFTQRLTIYRSNLPLREWVACQEPICSANIRICP